MKVHNYNVQSIHGISRRPVSKYHGIKALTLQTFLHKIKSRIMWLYKQVVLLTVYQLWPCNNKTGPLFFTNAKALLFSSTNFSKLSWIPHQTTKQSTPPLLLSWILEQNPPKKNGGKKTPLGKNGEKTGTSTNSPPLSTNTFKCSQMHLLCTKKGICSLTKMMFQNLLLQTALDVKTSKMTSIPAIAEIHPNPYYVGQRLLSETLSNKIHANRHLKELFGVIRSTIDPHLPLSKQPTKHRLHSFQFNLSHQKSQPPKQNTPKIPVWKLPHNSRFGRPFFPSHVHDAVRLGHFFGLRLHPPRWYLFRFDRDTLGFQTPAFIVSLFLGVVSLCFLWRGWCSFLCPCVFVVFFLLLGVCCFFVVVFLKRTAFWTWKEATLFSVHFWRWYCWEWFIFMR